MKHFTDNINSVGGVFQGRLTSIEKFKRPPFSQDFQRSLAVLSHGMLLEAAFLEICIRSRLPRLSECFAALLPLYHLSTNTPVSLLQPNAEYSSWKR
jgi:hypothetical protein